MDRTEKACASKESNKPDSVTSALSGGMGQNSPNLLWEACGRLPVFKCDISVVVFLHLQNVSLWGIVSRLMRDFFLKSILE